MNNRILIERSIKYLEETAVLMLKLKDSTLLKSQQNDIEVGLNGVGKALKKLSDLRKYYKKHK